MILILSDCVERASVLSSLNTPLNFIIFNNATMLQERQNP